MIDYELLDQSQSGIEIIEELDLVSQAILVTSRSEEESIISAVEHLQIKMIPKNMLAHIAIVIVKL